MKKEASVPVAVDFTKDYKSLKNCFEIVVTEDENENSSDEEDFNSEDDKIESMFDNEDNLLPPPSAVDFPVAPSSPEIKDSDLMFQFLEQTTDESLYRANSPEIEIPESCGSGKDPVTVTLTFRCGSDQNIEQALKAISNIIGDQIVDYTMVPDGRKKERDSSKDEKRETQISFCKKCSQPIFGQPIVDKKEFEYCTMSCLKIDTAVREDMSKNALKLGNSAIIDKKVKLTYRRKLFKICISDLMEKEIINDPKSKPALKPILSSFGVGRASQRKKQEEKLKMKNPENNGFWNYWSSNFGTLKSLVSNKDNPNRIQPSETIISEVLDTRKCLFCGVIGENNEAGRLLFYETKTWIHVNCVIWNSMVQELKTGGLLNVKNLITKAMATKCMFCNELGASINCTKSRCDSSFHFLCGRKANVTFHDNKSVFCPNHSVKLVPLTSIVNNRKLFIQTDEISQLTSAFDLGRLGEKICLRYGNISLASVGKIIPEIMLQIDQFRLPIGFKFTKRLWSHQDIKRRTDYSMQIEWSNREYFYSIQSNTGLELRKNNLGEDLDSVFSTINKTRMNRKLYLISVGQDFIFGFKVPQLKKLLSSLPWMEYIDPNGVNSSIRSMFADPVRKFTGEFSPKRFCGDNMPSSDQKLAQFVSLSADNVILKKKEERASIGLFAQKSFEADEFITEYIGEIKSIPKYNNTDPSKICIGDDLYLDGTLCVCSCRYINHNGINPNCTFEKIIIPDDKLPRIILKSIRTVETGDELTINFSESLNVR